MPFTSTDPRRRSTRVLAVAILAVLLGALIQASGALGATQIQDWTGDEPGTLDHERTDLLFYLPDGSQGPGGAAGTINLALDSTPVVSFCVESGAFLRQSGTVEADVSEVPLTTADDRAVLWILRTQTPTGTPTTTTQHQAAVAQVAVWVLRNQLRAVDPTNDPTVNADVAALIQMALTESATPSTLALMATAPAAGATSATITVAGTPGAQVTLAVASGPGALSATSVTIGPGGSASVSLTSSQPGTSVVSATSEGDGTLYRVTPADESQGTTFATGGQLAASTSVTFAAAPVVPTTPTTPAAGTPVAQVKRIAITKTGPARSKALSRLRYRITVRNTGTATLRNVVLRDRLPNGLSFVAASRAKTISKRNVTFRIGTLAAGRTRTVIITLRANASVRGSRVNTATALAPGVRPVRARAKTVFRPLIRRVQPAVTG